MKRLKVKNPTNVWYRSRLFWLLSCLGLLMVAGVAYGLLSKAAWDKLARSEEIKTSALVRVEAVFALPVDTSAEREAKKEALHQVFKTIQASEDPCYVAWVIAWQQVIGDLKRQQERCIESRNAVRELAQKLQPITTFLQDDASVAQALSELHAQQGEVGEAGFAQAAAVWERAAQNTRNVETGEQFKPVKDEVVASLEVGMAKWKELIASHEAKDKSRFLRAQQEIAAASERLVTSREVEQRELTRLIEPFQEALAALY